MDKDIDTKLYLSSNDLKASCKSRKNHLPQLRVVKPCYYFKNQSCTEKAGTLKQGNIVTAKKVIPLGRAHNYKVVIKDGYGFYMLALRKYLGSYITYSSISKAFRKTLVKNINKDLRDNYYQREDCVTARTFGKHRYMHAELLKDVNFYKSPSCTNDTLVKTVPTQGSVSQIAFKHLVYSKNKKGVISSLQMTNGKYVPADKSAIKIMKI